MNRGVLPAVMALTVWGTACGGSAPEELQVPVCNPACITGQICQAGQCVLAAQTRSPGGPCNADADCLNGEFCQAGTCRPITLDQPQPPAADAGGEPGGDGDGGTGEGLEGAPEGIEEGAEGLAGEGTEGSEEGSGEGTEGSEEGSGEGEESPEEGGETDAGSPAQDAGTDGGADGGEPANDGGSGGDGGDGGGGDPADAGVCHPIVSEPCGACGMRSATCNALGELEYSDCIEGVVNACGGCGDLQVVIGQPCGECGVWVCNGTEKVKCDDPGKRKCYDYTSCQLKDFCGTCPAKPQEICNGIDDDCDPGTHENGQQLDCDFGVVCSAGECCKDECKLGDKKCADATRVTICGNFDADGCLEWSGPEECTKGNACVNGLCDCVNDGTNPCAGVECGTATDSCGNIVTCGKCTAPQICGGGGVTGECGCKPKCEDQCGGVPDGCGGLCDTPCDWKLLTPAQSPPALHSHAFAAESSASQLVLFGGCTDAACLPPKEDTWGFANGTWTKRTPASWPPARYGHAMAFDGGRVRTVMFGGHTGANLLGDTWEWNGLTWSELKPALAPKARFRHAMVYDSATKRTLLFGGCTEADCSVRSQELWAWDGSAWVDLTVPTKPTARDSAGLAYDLVRKRVAIFGGFGPDPLGDTWFMDTGTWSSPAASPAPPARGGGTLTYLAARNFTVLFGGKGTALFKDTWIWNGTAWSQSLGSYQPTPRYHHAVTYDFARQRAVLFGGCTETGCTAASNQTWEYGGPQVQSNP